MEPEFHTLFRWLSLVLTLPVVGYAAWPFFTSAARGLRNASPGMDLPVSIALALAFLASAYATVTGQGHVYFDSVAMFTFLLLLARHLEFIARKRAQERTESLVSPVPEFARRIDADGDAALVPVAVLVPGDRVRVLPGESIPADAVVLAGQGEVGESRPVPRRMGERVTGGALNGASPLELRVERVGAQMTISRVLALVEQAAAVRPRLALLADRVAGVFVLVVLAAAAGVAAWWWHADAQAWIPATVAVLVVTCPCALSLATPTALTSAAAALSAMGLVPARGLAVEALSRVDHVVFDKTGTLTMGRYRLLDTQTLGAESAPALLRTAAALERHSEHPIARAGSSGRGPDSERARVARRGRSRHQRHRQRSALLAWRAWLGVRPGWRPGSGPDADGTRRRQRGAACRAQRRARCVPARRRRPGARALVDALKARGIGVSLYSGDRGEAVQRVAGALAIEDRAGALLPGEKLTRLHALAAQGRTTAMVGDAV